MKQLTRFLALALCLGLVFSLLPPVATHAAPVTGSYDQLFYRIEDGEVTITSCVYGASGDIEIPDNIDGFPVTAISDSALSYCDGITSLTIPDSVTSIGSTPFSSCKSLTGIWVGEKNPAYKTDASGVLYNKSGTTLIQCPAGITGEYEIPSGVTVIADQAFSGCQLTHVTIPNSVTDIGERAFSNAENLTQITIPDQVTTIKEATFEMCFDLTSVTLPEGITSIEDNAFYACDSLTDINIPNSLTSLGGFVFSYCTNLKCNSYGNGHYLGNESNPYYLLVEAADNQVTEVHIPSKTRLVAPDALGGYYYLTDICVDENNAYYRSDASGNLLDKSGTTLCQAPSGIRSGYVIPEGVIHIGDFAFAWNYELTDVTIPDSVKTVGNYAFYVCSWLNNVTLPDGLISIGEYAFSNCAEFTEMNIPEGVTFIGESAFSVCSNISAITIPSSVTYIGEFAFDNCSGLTTVTVAPGVTGIGDYVFHNCGITSIVLPESVTVIGNDAFSYCDDLTSVVMSDSVSSIGTGAFQGCEELVSVKLSKGITSIEKETFDGCYKLSKVVIPTGVIHIGKSAFRSCNGLTDVTIPASVTSIADQAFSSCRGLDHVYFAGNAPQLGRSVFSGVEAIAWYHPNTDGWDEDTDRELNDYAKKITLMEADHIWSEYTYDDNHTCTANGTEWAVCLTCGVKNSREAENSAAHRVPYASNNDATCTQDGTKTGICRICGIEETVIDVGSALGHSFTNYVSDNNYSCTEVGTETAKCDRCDETDWRWDMDSSDHRYVDGFCVSCNQPDPNPNRAVFTGTLAAYGTGAAHLTLTPVGATTPAATLTTADGTYSFAVAPGEYILTVTQEGTATRTYTVTLTEGETALDVKLQRPGDINGDGRVNVGDTAKAYAHAKKTDLLTDYSFLTADVNGDGRVNTGDVAKIYAHAKKTAFLW